MSDKPCQHKFIYQGVKYKIGEKYGGSGARRVTYFDRHFCEKCLEKRDDSLNIEHDTYQAVRFNATPT